MSQSGSIGAIPILTILAPVSLMPTDHPLTSIVQQFTRSYQHQQLMTSLPHPPHTMTGHRIPGSLPSPRLEVINTKGKPSKSSLPDRISGMPKWCSTSLKLIDREGRAMKMLWQPNHTLGGMVLLFSCGLMMITMASSCIQEFLGAK